MPTKKLLSTSQFYEKHSKYHFVRLHSVAPTHIKFHTGQTKEIHFCGSTNDQRAFNKPEKYSYGLWQIPATGSWYVFHDGEKFLDSFSDGIELLYEDKEYDIPKTGNDLFDREDCIYHK